MGIVRRLVASRHMKVLKLGDRADATALSDAKTRLVEMGAGVLDELFPLLDSRSGRDAARDVLTRILGPDSLDAYLDALGSPKTRIADAVEEILRESQAFEVSALIDAMRTAKRGRRRLESIIEARATEFPTPVLLEHLTAGDRPIQGLMLRLLSIRGDAAAIDCLMGLLESNDPWLLPQVVRLIGQIGTAGNAAALLPMLDARDSRLRLETVQTLGVLGNPESIPSLCRMLRDGDLKVHSAAIDVLTEIGDASAVPHLVDVLKDESEYARRAAVEVLNHVATTDAVTDLVRTLNEDDDWWVRSRAADALGTLGGDRVVEAILQLMDSEDDFVRRYAVEILISVPDTRAVEKLIGALDDLDWWVRERSIDALAKTGDPRAVEPLVTLLQDDESVAGLAATALAALGDERAVPALCEVALRDSKGSDEAVAALRTLARARISPESQALIRETLGKAPRRSSHSPGVMPIVVAPTVTRAPAPSRTTGTPLPPLTSPSMLSPTASAASSPDSVLHAVTQATPIPGGVSSGSTGAEPPPVPPAAEWESGELLLDRYRIKRKVGGGGFGWVYLVTDLAVNEDLILKVLTPRIAMDDQMRQRFVRELKLTRRITHRNVIRIHDLLSIGDQHAISMEYFAGRDLGKVLAQEKRLTPGRGMPIVRQVASGLAAAHAEGIIHRDVKPPNVLLGPEDAVKVVDFGLASMGQNVGSRLTQSGILIGTPHYMAPEQIKGDVEVDERIDVYSLGVMMYEMFSGTRPFEAESAVKILFQHLEKSIPDLSSVIDGFPVDVSDLVAAAMSRNRDDRPRTMAAFLETVERLAA